MAFSGCVSSNNNNDVELTKSFSNGDISFNYPSSWEEKTINTESDTLVEILANIKNDTIEIGVLELHQTTASKISLKRLDDTDYENGGHTKMTVNNKTAYLINTTYSGDGVKYKELDAYIQGENSVYLIMFKSLPEDYDYSLFLRILNTVKVQ